MSERDRLTFRARQILDDSTLPQNQRLPNAGALLRHLAESLKNHPEQLESMLGEIDDPNVRQSMRDAIAGINA